MFLIIDNTQRKIRKTFKEEMLKRDIPCVISDLDHADMYLPAALVIVTEKYLLEEVKYVTSFYSDVPVVLWDENIDMIEFALSHFKNIYGIEFENSKINHAVVNYREVTYCGRPIKLTRSERRILYFLMYNKGWYSSEVIAAYCLKGGRRDKGAVPVHICNLNSKAKRLTPVHIIDCRRFSGYRMKCDFKRSK